MTYKAELAKWLMSQRAGIITIDDAIAATGVRRDLSSGTLLRLSQEPALANRLVRIGSGMYQWTPDQVPRRPTRKSPARRLTPGEESVGAELFAEGHSEREVAEALDCSPSTAHRLYERLDAERKPVQRPLPETLTVTVEPSYFPIPGQKHHFRHFEAADGRKGTLWFHEESK